MTALLTTDLGSISLIGRGKVRDLYAVGDNLLLVATDRISAFDHVLATGIPGKGKILTQISLFWFELLSEIVPNHLITADVSEFPAELAPYADQLEGRSMLVKRATMFPVECVARGYLAGSGWKEYKAEHSVCGIALPGGLEDGSRLPEPIFTPATKSQDGSHDEKHFLRGRLRRLSASQTPPNCAGSRSPSMRKPRLMPSRADSSLPTRNSSSAAPRMEFFWPMKC